MTAMSRGIGPNGAAQLPPCNVSLGGAGYLDPGRLRSHRLETNPVITGGLPMRAPTGTKTGASPLVILFIASWGGTAERTQSDAVSQDRRRTVSLVASSASRCLRAWVETYANRCFWTSWPRVKMGFASSRPAWPAFGASASPGPRSVFCSSAMARAVRGKGGEVRTHGRRRQGPARYRCATPLRLRSVASTVFWWTRLASIQRPSAYETGALTG